MHYCFYLIIFKRKGNVALPNVISHKFLIMSKVLISLTLLFVTHLTNSQDVQTQYLDSIFKETPKENAVYIRTIKPHPVEKGKLFVEDHFIEGQLKSTSTYTDKTLTTKNAYFVSYYRNGNKEEEGFYDNGMQVDTWKSWYESGKPKEVSNYSRDRSIDWDLRHKLLEFYDQQGNQTVKDGSGNYIEYHKDTIIAEIGQYKNGLKSGEWKGFRKNGSSEYVEFYMKGKVIKGTSWDSLGHEYKYKTFAEPAEYPGGMQAFYNEVAKKMKYPVNARNKGISGKVYVQFEIDEVGKVVNVKIFKTEAEELNSEAIRVIKSTKDWKPGKERGQPSRQKIIMPINFSIS